MEKKYIMHTGIRLWDIIYIIMIGGSIPRPLLSLDNLSSLFHEQSKDNHLF